MNVVGFHHPNGTRITLHLPAPAGHAGEVMLALGGLGYDFDRNDEGIPTVRTRDAADTTQGATA